MDLKNKNIGIIGLGYVGLPLALEFAKHFPTIGFDIFENRISDLKNTLDYTKEISSEEILQNLKTKNDFQNNGFYPTNSDLDIASCNVFIVTVPTPIDESKKPNLKPLITASKTIAKYLKKEDVVIYESTTYPGCTEEICVPILEKISNFKLNKDFFVGYSPERINPGDKINTLTKIKKVTSGSDEKTAEFVDQLYKKIIEAGTYKAKSIKIAEASKAIENAQRDINISFINELALIFEKLEIDTNDVLEAANTKWNFLNYKPGLVGGHCIGVDPYYLAYKAEQVGYSPNVILSGRHINDKMGVFIAQKVVKIMINKGIEVKNSKILILGFTYKENCSDFRNTKVIDIYNELKEYGSEVSIFDTWANPKSVENEYDIKIFNDFSDIEHQKYDAIILTVSHNEFKKINIENYKSKNSVIYDCKGFFDRTIIDARL